MGRKKAEQKEVEIKDQKQQRITDCVDGINKLLEDYGCTLNCYFVISEKGNIPQIKVVSK